MTTDVLLIDDDPDVLESVQDRLEVEGMRVRTCRSFIEAVDHLKPGFAGVVITDIRMPGKTGLDLVARARLIDPELPVIVLTGFAETETVVKAMQGGAITVLEKPCPIDVLLAEIAQADARRKDILKTRIRNAQDASRSQPGRPPKEQALAPQLVELERQLIMRALKRNFGNRQKTAEDLGVSRSRLYAKIQLLGISITYK